ncbi:heavy-metal-associated domain-containing protein [Candidatus Stoquefichus massiliensis]|uniref:heavy-metal-associated domain-containing protein n=1 Tax=Candidatus Stoquefichus massiliensis TaxID=1470350 RepID=UPI0004856680|nr:heavy metal-associated domain-containing protein [Candidatus Stoquefichus massiliensis]
MATTIIFLVLMVIVIFAVKNSLLHFKGENSCCDGCSTHNTKSKKLKHQIIGSIEISVSEMSCQKCARKLTKSLHEIEGVSVNVNLKKKNIILSYDQPIDIQQVYDTIQNAGYQIICTHKIS